MTEVSIPRIEQGAAFLAALEPHVNKILLSLRLSTDTAQWSGLEAATFAELLEVMGDWIEGPGYRAQLKLHNEIADLTGLDATSDKPVLRMKNTAVYGGLLASIIGNLRLGGIPGHWVTFEGRDLHALKVITDDLVRRVFVIVPQAIKDLEELKGSIIG